MGTNKAKVFHKFFLGSTTWLSAYILSRPDILVALTFVTIKELIVGAIISGAIVGSANYFKHKIKKVNGK